MDNGTRIQRIYTDFFKVKKLLKYQLLILLKKCIVASNF